jgi:hypothetical protein
LYAAYTPPGPKPDDVNVDTDLIFTVTKATDWELEDFTDANVAQGDPNGGQGIFGAHVQALDTVCSEPQIAVQDFSEDSSGECSDSAFIFFGGEVFVTTGIDPDPDPDPISEPAHLALFGLGLIGLGVSVRRRRQQ